MRTSPIHRLCVQLSKTIDATASLKISIDRRKTAVVFTDGSVKNPGRPNASAGYGVFWGDDHPNNRSGPVHGQKDSNRAELFAVHEAIKTAADQGYSGINVNSDSKYVLDSVANPKQTHNRDLVQSIHAIMSIIKVTVQKVSTGSGLNKQADRIAKAGAEMSTCDSKPATTN